MHVLYHAFLSVSISAGVKNKLYPHVVAYLLKGRFYHVDSFKGAQRYDYVSICFERPYDI